jgi:hypothetical protein
MHEIKIRVLHKVYKQDMQNKSKTSQKRPLQDNKQVVMS